MLNLKKAKLGKFYKIQGLDQTSPQKVARRLLELGLTNGQAVRVLRKSLTKQTLLIEVRGYLLSLRSNIAEIVLLGENS